MSEKLFATDTNVTDADVVMEDGAQIAPPPSDELTDLLSGAFDEDAADEFNRTAEAAPERIKAAQSNLNPDSLLQRVALFSLTGDDTPSMGELHALMLMSHDRSIQTVAEVTKDEPASVLATMSMLNGGLVYPFTPIAEVPLFGTPGDKYSYGEALRQWHLSGMTAWFDRYAESLTAIAQQMAMLEEFNKTVYGMIGLLTDGFDNTSTQHDIHSLSRMVHGYRRMGTVVPFAVYVGKMPESGEYDYDREVTKVRAVIREMGLYNTELDNTEMTLRDLVKYIFTKTGFDPEMVFMPGQDIRAILKVLVTVSKLMVSVSRGQLPEGLTAI